MLTRCENVTSVIVTKGMEVFLNANNLSPCFRHQSVASDGRVYAVGGPDSRIAAGGNCSVKHALKRNPDRTGARSDFGRHLAALIKLGVP